MPLEIACILVASVSMGCLFGIYYELTNYRKHMGHQMQTMKKLNDDTGVMLSKAEEESAALSARIEALEMWNHAKRK